MKGRITGELQPHEIKGSKMQIIREFQKEAFKQEYEDLVKAKPIHNSSKLLPMKGWITKLIVKYYHEAGHHECGTNHTLATISKQFWVIKGREAIREYEQCCIECKKRRATAVKQIMAPLPPSRTKLSLRAFEEIGLDYGGPFLTKQGRAKTRMKRYLCLFTCLSSRAVHLEMAYNLTTDSFLNAFWRMTYRRGIPSYVISDNGTNFVKGNKELQNLVNNLDQNKIIRETSFKEIKWEFNPPYSPHFVAVFETMIKAAKRSIHSQLKNAEVTDEQLVTVLAGAESLINSKPLTYQSASEKDTIPLTPNHSLTGQAGGELAPEIDKTTSFHPTKRWR